MHVHAVAEPLYGLGNPQRRYVAQHFDCSSSTAGLGNCTYNSSVDAQCFIAPHVAGARCIESKRFGNKINILAQNKQLEFVVFIIQFRTSPSG